jgi:hypothetical protein
VAARVRASADEAGGRVQSRRPERDARLGTDGRLKKREQGTADEQAPHDSERKEEEGLRLAGMRQLGRLVGCTDGLRDLLKGRRPAAARWAYTSKGGLTWLSELDRI